MNNDAKRSNENEIYEWYEMNSFGGCCNKCDQCKQKIHVLKQIFSKKLKSLSQPWSKSNYEGLGACKDRVNLQKEYSNVQ